MTLINTVRLVGWAKTPSSSGNVNVSIDGVLLGKAAYPLPRQDVPNSGFIFEFDSLAFANGLRTVTVTSFDAQGEKIASASKKLNIANTPTKGSIESPMHRDPASGEIGVTGWALGKGGFKKLEVLINGRYAADASYGIPRSDVQAIFPEYNIANSGFRAVVNLDTLGLARGYHRITLVGLDVDDTRSQIAESEFFYTKGHIGRNYLDLPMISGIATGVEKLRVAGWTEGVVPASRVDVYIDDRYVGGSDRIDIARPDVPPVFPGVTNLAAFDFYVPSTQLVSGKHRIVAVVTDVHGQRANVDVFTGPISFSIDKTEKLFGVHLRPTNNYGSAISDYINDINIAPKIVMYFQPWRTANGSCSTFNEYPYLPRNVADTGAIPMITWEPHQDGLGLGNATEFSYARILSGAHDECINQTAMEVRTFGSPVMIRFAHEMNGQSNTWTGIINGNNPAGYVQVFRKIVDMFKAAGATNARFLWSPDHASPPEVAAPSNEIRNYYPGDGYVDLIGVSGYNWGKDPLRGGGWVSGEQIFQNFIQTMVRTYPGKAIMVTEIGSVPSYGVNSRSQWYTDTIRYLYNRPEVKGLVWFNDFAFAQTNEADFRFSNTAGFPGVDTAEKSVMKLLIDEYQGTKN
ncbi:glycoside hydrolase family 26 protein [Candidatus Nitrotoga sp. BS]|uniref:glycoside hydrolase family 26 protein n=1 Tax=Candidatus Nitrotoga sp. BS TaxID=2890408 RepID=UPI001EF1AA99|nr:glycosyl hydrolase [Candidatus Nitrotoga sp. BS]